MNHKSKAVLITGFIYAPDVDEESDNVLGVAHALGFGPGGEFTACDIAWPDNEFEYEMVDVVDCPGCVSAIRNYQANANTFKLKRRGKKKNVGGY